MMLIKTRYVKVSRRGAALTLFGGVFIVLGYSYFNIPHELRPFVHDSLRFAFDLAPIEFYGWAWVACGAVAIVGGLIHRLDFLGFAAAFLMPAWWAIAYFVAMLQGTPRAFVSFAFYALLASVILLIAGMADPLDTAPSPRGWL